MRRIVAIGLIGAVSFGCSASGSPVTPPRFSLEGSLSVVMDLGWDECVLDTASVSDEIAVRFIRFRAPSLDGGSLFDTPLKIVWQQAGQVLVTPATIDLAEPHPNNPAQQRGVVTRNVTSDKRSVFPLMVRGMNCQPGKACASQMSFLDPIRPDSTVRGQFSITFENGIEFANGRTVYGPFLAKVPP